MNPYRLNPSLLPRQPDIWHYDLAHLLYSLPTPYILTPHLTSYTQAHLTNCLHLDYLIPAEPIYYKPNYTLTAYPYDTSPSQTTPALHNKLKGITLLWAGQYYLRSPLYGGVSSTSFDLYFDLWFPSFIEMPMVTSTRPRSYAWFWLIAAACPLMVDRK